MMTLVKNVKVVYPGHELNGKSISIKLSDGVIQEITDSPTSHDGKTIDGSRLLLFPSLVDANCSIGEPGLEHKEDFKSVTSAAKKGGFGALYMLPNTDPVIDARFQIEHYEKSLVDNGVSIKLYGALSKNCQGKELSEMYDLRQGGALALSDGLRPVKDLNLMKRALEYSKGFNAIICSFPHEDRLNPGGMINESAQSIHLGLKSIPKLAEEMMVSRDLYLQAYAGGQLHFSTISTKESADLIQKAKDKNQKVTAGVALANVLFGDDQLAQFDSVFKTLPPLRDQEDRKAIIDALKAGTIDMIVANHQPENPENKVLEFDHAAYGMSMLETALSLVNEHLIGELTWDEVVTAFCLNPRKVFGQDLPKLEAGARFDFALFDESAEWEYNKQSAASKSANSPVWNQQLKGKVVTL